jgi:predicted Zn finger-like uncharacterized protein
VDAFTRCPACEALYHLEVSELAEAAGVVRCSNCGKTFNSLAHLFQSRPDEHDQPLRGGGMPPLLGNRIFLQHEIPGLDESDQEPAETTVGISAEESPSAEGLAPKPSPAATRSRAWASAAVGLLIALGAQAVWLFELPERLSGLQSNQARPPQDAIALIARDLHAHPSVSDAVVISATLRNRISTPIGLPLIELRLYDTTNQVLGVRRFPPTEYLPANRQNAVALNSGEELPIILEVVVTGSQPAGFEFRYFQDT